jgi:hypothetical protein
VARNLVALALGASLAQAAAAGPPGWEVAATGPARERLAAADGADLVLLAVADHRGRLGPCGCAARPLGGVARAVAWAEAVERAGVPTLLVHVGGWADPTPAEGARVAERDVVNGAMVEALARFDAVGLAAGDRGVAPPTTWLDPADPSTWTRRAGGLVVALASVAPGDGDLGAIAARLAATPADVRVLLANDVGAAIRDAAVPGIDVIVEAGAPAARWAPERLGEALWVRTAPEGQAISELRLDLDGGGAVVRSVDLDRNLPEDRAVRRLAAAAERARRAVWAAEQAP